MGEFDQFDQVRRSATTDARVMSSDGKVHLVPPMGRLTFCGRPPTAGTTLAAVEAQCADCRVLAAARDAAQARAPR